MNKMLVIRVEHISLTEGGERMNNQYELSCVVKNYLSCYYEILDCMIDKMTKAKTGCSISQNFINQMIPHHEAAIKMAENLLRYTTCIPLQNMANCIITEQTESIECMKKLLCKCEKCQNNERDICLYNRRFDAITQRMFDEMGFACADNCLNANFIRELIPHHEGGIRMSKNALSFCVCPELKPVLCSIIESQTRDVREMKRLLCKIMHKF